MALIKSLRDEIVERLKPKTSVAKPRNNAAPRAARRAQLHEGARRPATRAPLTEQTIRKGTAALYKGKPVKIQSVNESGMAVVLFADRRDPIYVRASDLKAASLNEGFLGMSSIPYTYVEPRQNKMPQFERLTAADLGLFETDRVDTEYGDDAEEDADNGANMRHDGHSGRTELDNLPTPSDTIATAYSDKIPPKHQGQPLSTKKGAEEEKLWQEPDWDGYTYPADAPDIPTADFPSGDVGNSRAPHFVDSHDGGDGQKNYNFDGSDEKKSDKNDKKDATKESFSFANYKKLIAEMDDLLGGGEDREPSEGDTITVTLPAMASIVCTAVQFADPMMLKAMIEALAEVGRGKTIDVGDLEAVACHVNGEEEQEVENRDAGRPEHEGISHDGGDDEGSHESHDSHDDSHEEHHSDDDHGSDDDGGGESNFEPSSGDGEPSKNGKTKLMGSFGESKLVDFYGLDDIVKEVAMSEEDEMRLIKKRAGMKYW